MTFSEIYISEFVENNYKSLAGIYGEELGKDLLTDLVVHPPTIVLYLIDDDPILLP